MKEGRIEKRGRKFLSSLLPSRRSHRGHIGRLCTAQNLHCHEFLRNVYTGYFSVVIIQRGDVRL